MDVQKLETMKHTNILGLLFFTAFSFSLLYFTKATGETSTANEKEMALASVDTSKDIDSIAISRASEELASAEEMERINNELMDLENNIEVVLAKGISTHYGDKFNGRKTANGEIFSNNELTCAHKTLPFGTILRVTNLDNDKTVIVRVNDRGPFVKGKHIDLSKRAFSKIGNLSRGNLNVKIEVLPKDYLESKKELEKELKALSQLDSILQMDTKEFNL